MLDTDTKRRIDSARDILVGKVPDPKSQVEQITIALIYKFMDDMDAESEEIGGKRTFFAGEFAKYGWARLMRSGLGGHEALNLYGEAIARMPENPGIPELFRDIFKNAYLPYRDPETLRLFLKIIDEFVYDHSERLGDAFEYLLSVLGSQGNAGQFRTPRHIIDFMVQIVDPKKGETVLDPACGTAGFLVSAYKHVLAANKDADGNSTLTPAEHAKLTQGIRGYDISPDMVRLSLVNLYLHGFPDPHIYEYDTLTSQERWNDYADVILANPPFMSPTGGIKPHNRFSVQSKRSEVLFVDYMAEHLSPGGRAAIIVPEGVIFQSQNAYVQLRKMLVEEYLVAVVSLPAGVFNPYSGVKTSILFLDKSLAKQADTIAFFKVENDGFGLGAQRRGISENDLPLVRAEVADYLQRVRASQSLEGFKSTFGLVVDKHRIAAKGEYNLNAEGLRQGGVRESRFPLVTLGEIAEVVAGQSPPGETYNSVGTGSPFHQGKTQFGARYLASASQWTTDPKRFAEAGDIVMSVRAPVGPVNLTAERVCIGRGLAAISAKPERAYQLYVFHVLRLMESTINGNAGATFPSINRRDIERIELPLPPLEVQREIVAEIEGYQKVIDGARAVLDNYRPDVAIDSAWPLVPLGDCCEAILTGPFGTSIHAVDYVPDGTPLVNPQDIVDGAIVEARLKRVSPETRERLQAFAIRENDIVLARRGEMGRCAVVSAKSAGWLCGTGCFVVRPSLGCDAQFLALQIASPRVRDQLEGAAVGVTMKNLNQSALASIRVPCPPIDVQHRLVAQYERERVLVDGNRELVFRLEQRIEAALKGIWDPAGVGPSS